MEKVDQLAKWAIENARNAMLNEAADSGLLPLRSILDEQDFALAGRLSIALGASHHGLLVGLSHAAQCLSKLCDYEIFSKLHQFYDATARIVHQLGQHKELPPHFTAVPDLRSLKPTFRLFVERGSRHCREIDIQICALKALAFTDSVARGNTISETFASRVLTLQRSATKSNENSKHWQKLAADLPFTQEHAKAIFEQTKFDPVREFIVELLPLLDGRVPDLRPKESTSGSSHGNRTSANSPEVALLEPEVLVTAENNNVSAEDDALQNDGHAPLEGFVAWQNTRSTNTHRLSACGFQFGWNHLHSDELRQVTRKLATILDKPTNDNLALACLAAVSLATGLPPKHSLEVPLQANEDLWLDIETGLVHWNLNRVVQRNPPEATLFASSYQPSSTIRMPLPISVVSNLKRLKQSRHEASTVRELLFPSLSDRADLLRNYELFLKLGDSSSHCARPSRFAYSFGRCILERTGQDVLAALCSLDFSLVAPGQLHYVCLSESLLFDALEKTYDHLGLGKIQRPPAYGYVGSPFRPRDNVVLEGWQKVQKDANLLRSLITPRMAISDFVNIFNQLILHNLGAIAFLSAHRGTRLERLTYYMLFSSWEFLSVSDKESTEYSAYRILPRFPTLAMILDFHLFLLRSLAKRLEGHDRKLAKRLMAICSGKRKNCPLFFFIKNNGKTWELSPVRTAHLANYIFVNFNAARNFGRHFWLSKLTEKQAPRMLPRFFLGHARRGMEPHGAAGGISVRAACQAIAPLLSSIAKECGFLDPGLLEPPASRAAQIPFSFTHAIKNLKNDFVEDYISSVDVPGHTMSVIAEPCPFDKMTLAGHSAIEFLRRRFVVETKSLTAWPRFLIALILFDGLCDSRLIEAAWIAIPDKLTRLGRTPIIECALPSGARPIFLQPATATCLNQAIGLSPVSFEQACRDVAAWAKGVFGFAFTADLEAINFLGALAARWLRIEISPWLMTSSNLEFSAACISMESIARVAYGRPAVNDFDQTDSPRAGRATRSSLETEIGDLAKIVNDIADTTKRIGENRKRLRLLYEALVVHVHKSSLSPLAADILTWLQHEATTERPLEVSSIGSYLSKLRDGLKNLDQENSFGDLDPDEWLELQSSINDGHAGEQLKQRVSILRRFAGFWRKRGCAVPGAIFASDDGAVGAIIHASSVYVSERDTEQTAALVADHFNTRPLLKLKAETKLSLCASSSFRSGEVSRIRSMDVGNHTNSVFITSSGFSHLKNQKHSRGNVELGKTHYKQLLSLRDTITQLSNHTDGYLWLLDNPNDRFADVSSVDRVLGRALRLVTGEQNARVHSLRGSTICRRVTPDVERQLANLAAKTLLRHQAPCANEHEWLKVSYAASQARHSNPLTSIRFYCPTWPIQLFLELSRTIECISIEDGYADLIDGFRRDALRKALSRVRREVQDAPLAAWQLLERRLSRITAIRSFETLLAATNSLPNMATRTSSSEHPTDRQCIHYLLLRKAGLGLEVTINESRVPTSYIPLLEEIYRQPESIAPSTKTVSMSEEASEDRRHLQRLLGSASGQQLMLSASRFDNLQQIATVIQLLDTKKKCDIDESVLLQAIRTLRAAAPREFTFNLLPSQTRSTPLLQQKIRAIDSDASIKRASKRHGDGFTLTLTTVDQGKRGPQPDGKATGIFRQALRARLILLTTHLKGEQDVRTPTGT